MYTLYAWIAVIDIILPYRERYHLTTVTELWFVNYRLSFKNVKKNRV